LIKAYVSIFLILLVHYTDFALYLSALLFCCLYH